ncbi:MAG: tetratricopeptide repeat protein, partial [Planctomycetes bacterium]|nr:tetratricopeptide repeat protein [Planctomycetota bacterium]
KFSPDGKWIVFCKAKSFMLLQPDSELYIIPAAGGEPRRLRANTGRMNSWHSWSPNGKWLVFSSKAYSVYTQLFLTHIDEQGRSTPPVVLANFTAENRAANIPEFVNLKPGAIKSIQVQFLDDTNYLRAGDAFRNESDFAGAVRTYRKALEINPNNAAVHTNIGISLMQQGNLEEARKHLGRAIELKPDHATAHCNLGIVLRQQDKLEEAAECFREALRADVEYSPAHLHLGALLLASGEFEEATTRLSEAVRLEPDDPYASFNLAMAFTRTGQPDRAADQLGRTLEESPDFLPALVSLALVRATSPDDSLRDGREAVELATRACVLTRNEHPEALHALAAAYAEAGRFPEAIATAETAVRLARSVGNEGLAAALERPIESYRRGRPLRSGSR